MYQIALDCENVCKDPGPVVRFRSFGESGLTLQLLAWIDKPELRGRVIDELSTLIYNSFLCGTNGMKIVPIEQM